MDRIRELYAALNAGGIDHTHMIELRTLVLKEMLMLEKLLEQLDNHPTLRVTRNGMLSTRSTAVTTAVSTSTTSAASIPAATSSISGIPTAVIPATPSTPTSTVVRHFPQFGGALAVSSGEIQPALYARGDHIYFSPIAGVVIRVPTMVFRDGTQDFIRAKSVRCKNGTARECTALRGNRECNFAHTGEKYVRIGYPTRCQSHPTIGHAPTLCADVQKITKKDMLLILCHGLSDIMVAVAWFTRNNQPQEINDVDTA